MKLSLDSIAASLFVLNWLYYGYYIFINDMHWDIPSLRSEQFIKPEPPEKKMFLSENVIFRDFNLSFGHFGQQTPESHVSQLQNGLIFCTSFLPSLWTY